MRYSRMIVVREVSLVIVWHATSNIIRYIKSLLFAELPKAKEIGGHHLRYKMKLKDCKMIVRVRPGFGESFDEQALDSFGRLYIRGLLRPKIVRKNVVDFIGPVGISLYDRLQKPCDKRDFLFIIEQVAIMLENLEMNRLSINRLVMDPRYIYLNEQTKEMQFLYIPCSVSQLNDGIVSLMDFVVCAPGAATMDSDFLARFNYYIKNLKQLTYQSIESFVKREDRKIVDLLRSHHRGESGFIRGDEISSAHNSKSDDAEETALLQEDTALLDEGTSLLNEDSTSMLDGTALLNWQGNDIIEETCLLNEGTALLCELHSTELEDGTCLLTETDHSAPVGLSYATLQRIRTDETIRVDKPVFRIGKERSYVDYFVPDNAAVSRSHADIITRGNRYYIVDLNSKNRTYVNEVPIEPNCETEICDGDGIRLGNEEFVFRT